MLTIETCFRELLPELIPHYRQRPDQLAMAELVKQVIDSGQTGMFEAATGTGKTLSYLVPALMQDAPVIVSTGTKNLQDQLFDKDVPMLQSLFPAKRIALLKGRANYLCVHRMKASIYSRQDEDATSDQLVSIRAWWSRTQTGDLGEIVDLDENPHLVPLITSSKDSCPGSRCPEYASCPLYRARDRAMDADLLIVNHHLLFADLAMREDQLHSLLPRVKAFIIDEAHQVPDIARQFFGQRLGSGQLTELTRDIKAELKLLGSDDPQTLRLVEDLEAAFDRLRACVLSNPQDLFSSWCDEKATAAIHAVDGHLGSVIERLGQVGDRSDGLAHCCRRAVSFMDQFALLTEDMNGKEAEAPLPGLPVCGPDETEARYVHWLERGESRFVIHLSPLSIADDMNDVIRESGAAWVFVSATLTVDTSFSHFEQESGLTPDVSSRFDSPFAFAEAVRAWVPAHLPAPGDDAHTEALVKAILPLLAVNPGRAFLLFTSHRAMRLAHELLKNAGFPLLVQGQGSRARLMELFRERSGSVLLATQSFWEGVDVSGTDMRLLVIDKLPFPNPSDPLFQAQSALLEEDGRNSFRELALPRTLLSLKQGFGRLIRRETDQGVFVLGDSRVLYRSYGGLVRDNLPEVSWQTDSGMILEWLQQL